MNRFLKEALKLASKSPRCLSREPYKPQLYDPLKNQLSAGSLLNSMSPGLQETVRAAHDQD